PFGDHTGFYSLPDRYPIVNVIAITHREDAVYPTTIVGLPPQEDYYLGKATERVFFPLLKTLIHDIDDYHLPMFGCFHNCAFIRIKKAYPLQARRVMHAVWGAGQMAWTKMIVVVDDDVDVHDEEAVLRAMFENCDFGRDIELVNGPLDILDHAAPRLGAGHKIGFDATRKLPDENVTLSAVPNSNTPASERPAHFSAPEPNQVHHPDFAPNRCTFLRVAKTQAGDGSRAIEATLTQENAPDFVIAVNEHVDIADWQQVFFHLCANADPGRDIMCIGNKIGFDATSKIPGEDRHDQPVRDYPPILEMEAVVRQRVSERAAAFGLT
ncbi:MAG: menaquinone biosynthesis decarboxylase, partial [Phycisphaerales bacterium]